MNILITTQAVDTRDPALGFFCRWIEEFAKRYDRVDVICLAEGEHNLPGHVHVHSLGKDGSHAAPKESRLRILTRMRYALRFYSYAWSLRREYDAVFVHMNPEYVVLGGVMWKLWRKRVALWYMHKSVTLKLRIAEKLADIIFTATPESFRLSSSKVRVVGHGIDMRPLPHVSRHDGPIRIASIGRLSASKGIREAFLTLDVLYGRDVAFAYVIAGAPMTRADREYERLLKTMLEGRVWGSAVRFVGPVSREEVPAILSQTDIFLHLSDTGSLDKAQLEALIAGVPTITSNDSGKKIVPREWCVDRTKPHDVANAIQNTYGTDISELSARVTRDNNLPALIGKIHDALTPQAPHALRTILLRMVQRALLFLRDVIEPMAGFQEVSILCYHSIGGDASETTVTPESFERHLRMIEKSGAIFVSTSEIISWLNGTSSPPRRAVALTFDDGYRDFLSTALPILERHGAPATLFVTGDGEQSRPLLENDIPLLSDTQIEALREHPLVTIGYHSLAHARLSHLDDASLERECAPRFGAKLFAYPGGNYDERSLKAVRTAGYQAAFSIKRGLVTLESAMYLLPRNVILRDTPDWMVRSYTTKAIAWYRRVRNDLQHHG